MRNLLFGASFGAVIVYGTSNDNGRTGDVERQSSFYAQLSNALERRRAQGRTIREILAATNIDTASVEKPRWLEDLRINNRGIQEEREPGLADYRAREARVLDQIRNLEAQRDERLRRLIRSAIVEREWQEEAHARSTEHSAHYIPIRAPETVEGRLLALNVLVFPWKVFPWKVFPWNGGIGEFMEAIKNKVFE